MHRDPIFVPFLRKKNFLTYFYSPKNFKYLEYLHVAKKNLTFFSKGKKRDPCFGPKAETQSYEKNKYQVKIFFS